MAQSTAGITLYYGTSVVTDEVPAEPVSWTALTDITSTPALSSSPAKLDSTTLAETVQKTYINGLQDLGGSFEFGANMTSALVTAVALAAADAEDGTARAFKVSFPAPLSKGYWWTGTIDNVAPGESSVDAVATTTLYISQATALTAVDENEVS
ncbi:MAG: hypothetical protein JRC93_04045 [Deltaproteobacteria bacterium]|nr:hypothetical protein [Deltaproteobacteria bacterium]